MPKLMSIQQAADFIQVSPQTIDKYRRDDLIRHHKIRGTVRFVREDFEIFLNTYLVGV